MADTGVRQNGPSMLLEATEDGQGPCRGQQADTWGYRRCDGDDDGGVRGGAGDDKFNTVDVVPGGNGPLASGARKGGCY